MAEPIDANSARGGTPPGATAMDATAAGTPPGLRISTDPADVDLDAVHAFLSTTYWAEGIPRGLLARAIAGSMPFSVLEGDRQVGFARVITDHATFAYLADVYVLEAYRGRGVGKWLVETIMAHPALQGLRRFMLVTRDAHALYAPVGFTPLAAPERHMEIARPGLYRDEVAPEKAQLP